jgi:Tol biopolymer transport system component
MAPQVAARPGPPRRGPVVILVLALLTSVLAVNGIAHAEAAIAVRGVSHASSTSASVTVETPSGAAPGDVIVASIDVADRVDVFAPAGWQLVKMDFHARAVTKASFVRVVSDEEPAAHTFTTGRGPSVAVLIAFEGVDAGNPLEGVNGRTANRDTSIVAPGVATSSGGAMVVGLFTMMADGSITLPGELEPTVAAAGPSITSAVGAALQHHAGSTGDKVAQGSARTVNVGHLIALRPASTASVPDPDESTTTTTEPESTTTTTEPESTTTTTEPESTTTTTAPSEPGDPADVPPIAFTFEPEHGCGADCAEWTVIRATDPYGSRVVDLTSPEGAYDRFPRWSPDGSRIALSRTSRSSGAAELVVVDIAPTGPGAARTVTNTAAAHAGGGCSGDDLIPAWSPDSTKVAATCAAPNGRDSYVLVAAADGSKQINVPTATGHADSWPTWAPDSSRLAFARQDLAATFGDPGWSRVWVADVTATGIGAPQPFGGSTDGAVRPEWSPRGEWLLFTHLDVTLQPDMKIAATGSTEVRSLFQPSGTVMLYGARWSGDGSQVAVAVGNGTTTSTINVITLAGASSATVPADTLAYAPAWSPNGAQLVLDVIIRNEDGGALSHLAVAAADGSSFAALPTLGGHAYDADWRPLP